MSQDTKLLHYAYKRIEKNLQNQSDALLASQLEGLHFDKVFADVCDASEKERKELLLCMKEVGEGIMLHIQSLDILARNFTLLENLIQEIIDTGAHIYFHKEDLFFRKAASKEDYLHALQLKLLKIMAEYDTENKKFFQQKGIAQARERGAYRNRPSKLTEEDRKEIARIANAKDFDTKKRNALISKYKISKQSIYVIRQKYKI